MDEEEIKAIENIISFSNLYKVSRNKAITVINKDFISSLDILLNLIEKQEKLIQGLNKQADELVDDYEKQLQEKNEYIFRLESKRDRWE